MIGSLTEQSPPSAFRSAGPRTVTRVSEPTAENPTENPAEPKTESHDPAVPAAYAAFMRTGWGDRELDMPRHPVADPAAARRAKLADAFPGERLVLPAGTYKVRANDTDYRFRPDTAHTYFSGNQTSDAVLVIEDGESVLYARPRSERDTDEFFRDRQYGELWAGRRPSAQEISDSLGIEVRHVKDLPSFDDDRKTRDITTDEDLGRVADELRLIKDEWEVGELQEACDITTLGFEDSVREWDRVLEFGERWIEGTFFRRARAMGNDIGYDSICAGGSHATTLHWIDNTGSIEPGKLVLLDMGVEGHNLYTADVTRTLPVDGTFTPVQRDLYDLVFTAQQKGIEAVRPGVPVPRRPPRRDGGPRPRPVRPGTAAGLGRGGARPGVQALLPLDAPRHLAHARHGRPRLRSHVGRHLPQGRPRRGHGPHRRARPLLPGGRPARPRGAARHRHPHRGRHPRDRRRPRQPLGRPPPHLRRRGGVDGSACARPADLGLPPLRRLPLPLLQPPRGPATPGSSPTRRRTRDPLVAAPAWLPTVAGPESGFRNKAKMAVGGTVDAPDARDPRPGPRRHRPP